ncbi:sucrase ferredoxin [Chromobacterium violaceum]|uniref:sucrase ferredoxin n=1 Tax=Chromobacterium violaceum TaxID=536 RepID=UPI001CE04E71|nr:sucrase ferredoxin [Chromobacterium violaceum]
MNNCKHDTIRFCARESAEREESILGTATESSCYILIECAGPWPSKVADILCKSTIPENLSRAIGAFIEWCPEVVHPLLIKQPGRLGPPRIYIIRSTLGTGACLHYDDLKNDYFSTLQDAYLHPEKIGDIILVCTHGKVDKCCAKFGKIVYDQLRVKLESKFEIFQCSHIGGDRFAANVLWLPHGIYLGHVHIGLLDTIDKLKTNSIPLQKLRGTASLPSAAQYLEGHLRAKLFLEYPGAFELLSYHEQDVGEKLYCHISLKAVLNNAVHEGYVSIHRSSALVLASCNVGGEAHPRVFSLIDEDTYWNSVNSMDTSSQVR